MGEGGAVEVGAEEGPVGEAVVHEGAEAVGVVAFEEVDEFVDEDVFEADGGLLASSRSRLATTCWLSRGVDEPVGGPC